MMSKKRVLVVGFFSDTSKNVITQAGVIARILKGNGYDVYTVSRHKNRVLRMLHIVLFMIFKASKYDVALVQFFSGHSFIYQYFAANIAKVFGKKLVFTIRGGSVPARIKALPNRYLPVLRMADVITCPSSFTKSELSKYDIDTVLLENSIPLEKYVFRDKSNLRPTLLWMRTFAHIYNPEMAVEVAKELKKDYPDVKLYMGGPDLGKLQYTKDLIEQYQLQDNVELIGFVDMEKKIAYSEKADMYICTNRVDNAPVTFLEMWAMGLPIISTNVGGIPFLVKDGEDAVLVSDEDYKAMAEQIKILISDNAKTRQLVAKGKQRIKAFSEEEVYKKWHSLLSEL